MEKVKLSSIPVYKQKIWSLATMKRNKHRASKDDGKAQGEILCDSYIMWCFIYLNQ